MVVSVLTTPYAWLSDEVVLLPAILQAAMWIYGVRKNLTVTARLVIVLFAGLNALLLLILSFKIPFATGIYFWSSLVWFSFYFYGRRLASPLQTSAHTQATSTSRFMLPPTGLQLTRQERYVSAD